MNCRLFLLVFTTIVLSSVSSAQAPPAPDLVKLQAAVSANPSDANAWENLGNAYAATDKYPDAIAALKKALELNYNPNVGKYNLACAYAKQGTPESKQASIGLLKELVASNNAAGLPLGTDPDLANLKADPTFQQLLQSIRSNNELCRDSAKHPEYRGLDFWVGEWDVYAAQQVKVGESSVQLILKDCVVFENWTALNGQQGKSFNKYNTQTKKWEQYWVDDQGHTTFYSGDAVQDQIRYAAESLGPNRGKLLRHLTFTKLDGNRVEQKEDVSTDEGKTWTVGYDFTYVRKNSAAQQAQGTRHGGL